MIRVMGTIFAGLLGLAFGSFLNVCLSRWPQGESVVTPGSHCRDCPHPLSWWENIPLISWIALRGRCRGCGGWIGWRYPLVEAAMGLLWAGAAWKYAAIDPSDNAPSMLTILYLLILSQFIFSWLMIALGVLDAEHLWLPDWLTLPGTMLGFLYRIWSGLSVHILIPDTSLNQTFFQLARTGILGIVGSAALVLVIRWLYQLIRHREGLGLGDAKLMALLGAWLGFQGALLSFAIGVVLGALVGLILLAVPTDRRIGESWALIKLPLGTFLCIGGIISSLWGQPIIDAYLRWAGF